MVLLGPIIALLWIIASPMALWYRWRGWGSRSLRFMPLWILAAVAAYVAVFVFSLDFIELGPSLTAWLFVGWFTVTIALGSRQLWLAWQRLRARDHPTRFFANAKWR